MRALPNLVSSATSPCTPWLWTASAPAEVKGKEGKKARDAWINNPSTVWQVYSLWEGLNESQRISKAKAGQEGNPPFKCHGLAGDYDAPMSDEDLQNGLARLPEQFQPAYFERTLSGNGRLLWLFEEPVTVPSRDFAVAFLNHVASVVKFDMVAVGFDRPAFVEPNRYYTNSGDWYELDASRRLPKALVQGWVMEVAKKFKWEKQDIVVPLPVVWTELQKRYPHHGWEGDFIEEAQGPSFFIEGATSPKSAIVKTTGMFTFSAHAAKPFWSWSDLLGADFVKSYETAALGKAVEGIWHDGTKYFAKDGPGSWRAFSKEDIREHLVISRGLNGARERGQPSQADMALEYIRHWQAIDGAAPFAFRPFGVFSVGGPKFLNTHTRRVVAPADNSAVWGPAGNFPWLSAFLDHLFDPKDQLEFFLSWLARFYRSAYELDLQRGQSVFIIGPPGTGKTLLNQNILAKLMGGSAEAQSYLLGETNFNSQLFEVALWTVDDSKSTTSNNAHAMFSSMVKKLAANQTFEYHAKFRVPCTVEWLGRVVVTANNDEESLRIIPDLGISNRDKTMLFKTTADVFQFPAAPEIERILKRELPYFARFLLDYQIPEQCVGTARYGVKEYHEPTLLREAAHSSATNAFWELLSDWHTEWFKNHPKESHWKGTTFQLARLLMADEATRSAAKVNGDIVGRKLAGLKAKGYRVDAHVEGEDRIWTIHRNLR